MTAAKKQSHFMLILVCLLCDVFVRPFEAAAQFNARTSIIGAIIGFCAFALLAAVFLKLSSPVNVFVIKLCLLLLFISTSAAAIVKAEQFYRFISDKQLPVIAFAAVFIAVIIYTSKMPQNALARSAVAVALLSILTVVLIIISNFKDLKFQRLEIGFNSDIIKSALYHFNFSSEILLFYVITSKNAEKQNSFTAILLTVLLVFCVLQILGEAVMGSAAALQTQPVNILSKIGSISVFKRLDSFYSAIWMLGMLIKAITFYVYGFNLIEHKTLGKQLASVLFLVISVFIAYNVSYSIFIYIINIAAILLAASICAVSLLKRRLACEKNC